MPLITLESTREYVICCISFERFVWVIQCTVGLRNAPPNGLTPVLYTNLLKAFAQFFLPHKCAGTVRCLPNKHQTTLFICG